MFKSNGHFPSHLNNCLQCVDSSLKFASPQAPRSPFPLVLVLTCPLSPTPTSANNYLAFSICFMISCPAATCWFFPELCTGSVCISFYTPPVSNLIYMLSYAPQTLTNPKFAFHPSYLQQVSPKGMKSEAPVPEVIQVPAKAKHSRRVRKAAGSTAGSWGLEL